MYSLEPVDLKERMLLGKNALLAGLAPTQNHLPYWNCGWADGELTAFGHSGAWDKCHDVGRAIHALCMVERVVGEKVPGDVLSALAGHLYDLFDGEDDLPGTPSDTTGKRFVHLHNIRENLHALTALIKRGDTKSAGLARKMVRKTLGLVGVEGQIKLDLLPATVELPYKCQPEQEGRALDALVRYYRASDDAAGLELVSRLARYALANCFTPYGTITELAGTHGHSIAAVLAGLCDYALLTNDAEVAARAKLIFDNGLPRFNSSFGWSMESLHIYTCDTYSETKGLITRGESNNTGDILRAALTLGHLGYPQYFAIAERILRSHLLPSQLVDVSGMSDDANAAEDSKRQMASRIKGGFSFPIPNDLLYDASCPIMTYDITSGAVDGLCEAYDSMADQDFVGLRVHLLLDQENLECTIRTKLPMEGVVEITYDGREPLLVAEPTARVGEVYLTVNGARVEPVRVGGYLLVQGSGEKSKVVLTFTPERKRTVESMAYVKHTIDWVGEQIVAMSPAGKYMPFFPPIEGSGQ